MQGNRPQGKRKNAEKKTTHFLRKTSSFKYQRIKYMPLKLHNFHDQFIIGAFSIKSTQSEKTGSIGKIYMSLESLIIKFHFRNEQLITFSVTLKFCCLIVEFAFLYTKERN